DCRDVDPRQAGFRPRRRQAAARYGRRRRSPAERSGGADAGQAVKTRELEMAGTMKAFRLTEWEKPPRLVDAEIPKPGHGQVLIKVAGAGLCHSDIGMMAMPEAIGKMAGWSMPYTLGHEVGGWVAELGPGVQGLAAGNPVVLVSAHSCGHCHYCMSGNDNSCVETYAGRGYGRDGGLAEYGLVDSPRFPVKLNGLDPREAGP